MRTKKYPSDIGREQLEIIRPLLESARKKTKPRTVELYEVLCAALYLLRTGCQWRALPSDFPMTCWRRRPAAGLIFHSDRGSQHRHLHSSLGYLNPMQYE